jgi:hypothetical protein
MPWETHIPARRRDKQSLGVPTLLFFLCRSATLGASPLRFWLGRVAIMPVLFCVVMPRGLNCACGSHCLRSTCAGISDSRASTDWAVRQLEKVFPRAFASSCRLLLAFGARCTMSRSWSEERDSRTTPAVVLDSTQFPGAHF